jgi:hypothetical protein
MKPALAAATIAIQTSSTIHFDLQPVTAPISGASRLVLGATILEGLSIIPNLASDSAV